MFEKMNKIRRNALIGILKMFFLGGWRPYRTGFSDWEINRYILDIGERPLGASGIEVFRKGSFVWLYCEVRPIYARANKIERGKQRVRKLIKFVYRMLSF